MLSDDRLTGGGKETHLKVVSILLIVLVSMDTVTAKPMSPKRRNRRGPKPKWVNPCGINPQLFKTHALQAYHEAIPLSDRELMQNVILAARNALIHSDAFKEKFVRRTFSAPSWQDHHQTWKDQRLHWLPSWHQIPKHLNEKLDAAHLQEIRMENALSKMYSYLQKIAVGLEQVVLDQAVYDGDFIQEFNEAEYKLKAVLCELQVAMLERGVEPEEDIRREIMSQDVRDIEDSSYRNLRDWYIYRDYMNGLEYVIHSFDHLKNHNQ
ncbi:uncharacterized protein LOC111704236 isoform X2 [Eurytemora carolleeae]|uniref:uncharacterized protein LOC111704236 isoform X2 n=1 Tax=Eurytemora carolleeae TaxID=1294199 RepID=UPI000C780D48|nr:uncharacterized protein LOC111704236 isoform X2 [Eurytemora carolleeae]|eukprot:XP_023332161.1 uncharacterized protein LOC111704236 isoform X2 [Eurytemora affinis]